MRVFPATVIGTTSVAEPQGVLVYNFTVAEDHTYFVEGFGSASNADGTTESSAGLLDAVWVHNECDLPDGLHEWSPSELGLAQRHQIVSTYTNASKSVAESQKILASVGIDLQDERNIVDVAGHIGPHPEEYHFQVHNKLTEAVDGLESGSVEYVFAVRKALSDLKTRLISPNDSLTQLITR